MTPALADRYRAACAALGLPVWRKGASDTDGTVCPGAWADERLCDPDFSDPATVGCLLAAVREAWSAPTACAAWSFVPLRPGVDWFVTRIPADAYGATEAEALIAALEAAARKDQP